MMNDKLEQKLPRHMLYHKEHGYSVLCVLRLSAIRYLLLAAFFGLCVMLNWFGNLPSGAFIFMAGLFAGAIARDAGWIRQARRIWPVYVKVLDWTKVKAILEV